MVEVLPHGPVAPFRPSVVTRWRGGVDAEQDVDVRAGRQRGELLTRRPRFPRVCVAPPEHRLEVLGEESSEELVQPCRRVVVPHRRRRAAGRDPHRWDTDEVLPLRLV